MSYVGDDYQLEKELLEFVVELDGYEYLRQNKKSLVSIPSDITIFDCRKKLLPVELLPGYSDGHKAKHLCLIAAQGLDRKKILEYGFHDYLIWPLIKVEFYLRLASCLTKSPVNRPSYRFSKNNLVERACLYMDLHMAEDIRLAGLSLHLGTNINSLTVKFKSEFGAGPMSWLRRHRIHKAAYEIEYGNRQIAEIALSVGYRDANNFSTSFKAVMGISPIEYRKMNISKKSVIFTKVDGDYFS